MDENVFTYKNIGNFTVSTDNFYTVTTSTSWWTNFFKPTPWRAAFVYIPDGIYKPADLGLPFKEVSFICVGKCFYDTNPNWFQKLLGAKVKTHLFGNTLAHADQEAKSICFQKGTYIYEKPNQLSETAWHEYAHILAGAKAGHGKDWAKFCETFGIVSSPYATYILNGEPFVSYDEAKKKGYLSASLELPTTA